MTLASPPPLIAATGEDSEDSEDTFVWPDGEYITLLGEHGRERVEWLRSLSPFDSQIVDGLAPADFDAWADLNTPDDAPPDDDAPAAPGWPSVEALDAWLALPAPRDAPAATVAPSQPEPPSDAPASARTPDDDPDPTFADLCLPITETPPERLPAILERDDGETVIYTGRFTSIYGEPAGGKSWAALIVALEAARRGGRVCWWDHEDRPATLAQRAQLLGGLDAVTDPDVFRFVTPELADYLSAKGEALAWLLDAPEPTYSLVVIDSAEAGGCPSDGADVAPWLNAYVEPWRRNDVAVVVLDHVAKRREGTRGAIGSTHKRSRVDGAALLAIGTPWTKKTKGHVTLVNEKDRPGDLPVARYQPVATITGTYDHNGAFAWAVTAPKATALDDSDDIDGQLLAAIAAGGDIGLVGSRALRDAIGGNGRAVDRAAARLITAGLVTKTPHGRGYRYRITDAGHDATGSNVIPLLSPRTQ